MKIHQQKHPDDRAQGYGVALCGAHRRKRDVCTVTDLHHQASRGTISPGTVCKVCWNMLHTTRQDLQA